MAVGVGVGCVCVWGGGGGRVRGGSEQIGLSSVAPTISNLGILWPINILSVVLFFVFLS